MTNLTSLAAISLAGSFLLAGCVSQEKYDALQTENQQLHQQQQQTAEHVARLQDALKYTVESDMLFKSGSWTLSQEGQDVVAKVAQKLAPLQQSKIVINGYTDNAPISSALKRKGIESNDVLSQKRAEAVMEYMISHGVQPDYVSARGFGDAEPVAPNDTAQGRALNRRVEFTLNHPGS